MVAKKARLVCAGALITLVMAGCSEQQEQEDLEISDDQQGNVDDQEANESNSEGNFEDQENEQANNEQADQVNNDVENDTQETPEDVDAALENPPANNGANAGLTPSEPEAVTDPALANPGGNTPAANPAPAGDTAPVPGGRVRYVTSGTAILDKPGGAQVGQLTQGDHPVTWEENGWLRITNGMYVPVDAMSDAGVPRPMPGNRFQ